MSKLTVDIAGWTQDEVGLIHAATAALLHKATITHKGISVRKEIIEVKEPSADVSPILTSRKVRIYIDSELTRLEVANKIAQIEAEERRKEIESSPFRDIKLSQIDTMVDAVAGLADAKDLMRKFMRYMLSLRE